MTNRQLRSLFFGGCIRKRPYKMRTVFLIALKKSIQTKKVIRPYHCHFCNNWHLTSHYDKQLTNSFNRLKARI